MLHKGEKHDRQNKTHAHFLTLQTQILSPEFAIFEESSRAQEEHLSELIDINLLIECLDQSPRITLNFMKILKKIIQIFLI